MAGVSRLLMVCQFKDLTFWRLGSSRDARRVTFSMVNVPPTTVRSLLLKDSRTRLSRILRSPVICDGPEISIEAPARGPINTDPFTVLHEARPVASAWLLIVVVETVHVALWAGFAGVSCWVIRAGWLRAALTRHRPNCRKGRKKDLGDHVGLLRAD